MKTAAQIFAERLAIHEDHPAIWPLVREWANAEAVHHGDNSSVLLVLAHNGLGGTLEASLNRWIIERFMPNLAADLEAVIATKKPTSWGPPERAPY